jgi:hypothetical protein
VRSVRQARPGQVLDVLLADGRLSAKVADVP